MPPSALLRSVAALDDLPQLEDRPSQSALFMRGRTPLAAFWEALHTMRARIDQRLQAAGGTPGALFVAVVEPEAGEWLVDVGVLLRAPAAPFADLRPATLAGGTFLRADYTGAAGALPDVYAALSRLATGLRYRRVGPPVLLFSAGGPPPATLLVPVRVAPATPRESVLAGVALTGPDAKALATWYGSVLGVRFVSHGPEYVQADVHTGGWASPRFVLAPSGRVDERGRPPLALRFRVPDLTAALARLTDHAVEVVTQERRPDGPAALVRDPHGLFVELWEADDA